MPYRKLKEHETASQEALRIAIETKDRRYRIFSTLAIVGVILLQGIVLYSLNQSIIEARKAADRQSEKIDESQDTILRRLDCFAVYFSQQDRPGITIADIDKCTLSRNGTAQEFFIQRRGEAPVTTEDQQPTGASNQSSGGAVVPIPTHPPQDNDDNEQIEPRPPLTLNILPGILPGARVCSVLVCVG